MVLVYPGWAMAQRLTRGTFAMRLHSPPFNVSKRSSCSKIKPRCLPNAQHMNTAISLLKNTVRESLNDKVMRLSAAMSYYAIFSLAPLLLIAISIAGFLYGQDAASGLLAEQLQQTLGAAAAETVQDMIASTRDQSSSVAASIIGVIMMLVGAGGVFLQLQDALNIAWGLAPNPDRGVGGIIRDRLLSFSMVLTVGFLLLISLLLTTFLQAMSDWVSMTLPLPAVFWSLLSAIISFAVIAALFAAIFRVLPDAELEWRDVRLGAVVTAVLFVIGKFVLGWYLGREATTSGYGSAGALIVVLLWVYYSTLILLVGAEFTQVYAEHRGREISPSAHAIWADAQ